MLTPTRLLRRLRALLNVKQLDDELDEELRFHQAMETEKRIGHGQAPENARIEAQRAFGGTRYRDDARDARGFRPLEDFLQDLRVGIRAIGQQRTYAAVAVLTLAIGIGATTALGSAVYRVLLAPYPFAAADRIVTVWQTDTRTPSAAAQAVAPGNFLDWARRARSFDLLAAVEPYSFDWVGPEGPEAFETALVTADFFPIQGLRPVLGRAFMPEEFQPGRDNVVVLTETLWRNRFGSDSSLIGRTLILDTLPRTVVGIMPEDAMQPFDAEIWAPKIYRPDELTSRSGGYWQVVARLAPGVTIEQADTEMRAIAGQLATEFPTTNSSTGAAVVSLREAIAGSARTSLLVLLGAVAFVMLIACVNVASLQLAEAVRRRREMAIRTAIGAGRGRLLRQRLTESLLVALIGCAAGIAIAFAGVGAIRAFAPSGLWQLQRLHMDGASLLLALTLAVVAAVSIGIMSVAAGRVRLAESLAAGGRSGSGGVARRRANRVLVVSEIALALVLLVGAGLLLRSLAILGRTDRGFASEGILVTTVQAWSYYPTQVRRAEFVRDAIERLRAIPGVEAVGMTSSLPLSWPIGFERTRVAVEGRVVAPGDELPAVRAAATTPGYFEALGIPLEQGRAIAATDLTGSPPVALVNRTFARRHFGSENPIGKRVTLGFMGAPLAREIVGVVGDVRHEGLHEEPTPTVFIPHAQGPTGAIHFVTKVAGEPAAFERRVRAELTRMNGAMPLSDVTTMDALVGRSLRERRFQLGLLACFSGMALVLAAIGIYGVMSRVTSERTHEIGVRMAVGARAADVRWMVLRNGGALAVVGIVAGGAIAFALTRYMAGMLFGVTPLDPVTYVSAAAVLLAAAVGATWLPAWRASRVDPVVALRSD